MGRTGGTLQDAREMVKAMRPIDDEFFRHIAEDKGAVEEIVQAALSDEGLRVETCQPQVLVDVVGRRSIWVDALCRTADGRLVNVEAQTNHIHDDLRRARVHLSELTVAYMPKGAEFKDAPNVAVVYLADYDPLGMGLPTYTIASAIREVGVPVDDGAMSVLVNGTAHDGSPLSRVMRVLCDREAEDYEACPRLSARKDFIRNSEEAQQKMSETMQEMLDRKMAEWKAEAHAEGRAEGVAQGREEGRQEGREQGRQEGREQGRQEGREEGREQGREEGRQEGREEGREQGREEGRQEGREEGREQGRQEGREEGRKQGLEKGLEQGLEKGLEQGLEKGLEKGLEQGRAEMLADLVAAGMLTQTEADEWVGKTARHSGGKRC